MEFHFKKIDLHIRIVVTLYLTTPLSPSHTYTVSPHLVLEAVRQWLHEGTNGTRFEKIVFSAKANVSLIEKHMDDYFPLQPFASQPPHERTASEVLELVTKPKEVTEKETVQPNQARRIENGILESDKVLGTDNETVTANEAQSEISESDKPQNGTQTESTETQTVKNNCETNTTAHKDLMGLHERVSVVSIGGIEIDMADENTAVHEEPISEDVEPESDTETGMISVDNIDLDLQGVDDEMSNIQSILLEMHQEQKEVARKEQENVIEQLEEEDPIGLLRFLQNTSQQKEIQCSNSTSASAHASPIHQGLTSKTNLSRSLPGLLDNDKVFSVKCKLNRQRIESDV